jgi:hypothetical protein
VVDADVRDAAVDHEPERLQVGVRIGSAIVQLIVPLPMIVAIVRHRTPRPDAAARARSHRSSSSPRWPRSRCGRRACTEARCSGLR